MSVLLAAICILPLTKAGNSFGYSSLRNRGFGHSGYGDPNRCNISRNNNLAPIQARITGGQLAEVNSFPYQVGLVLEEAPNVYQCGGSLISINYVLSAAHCLVRTTRGRLFFGSNEYANASTATSVIDVTSNDYIIHEKYIIGGGYDDIALIRLPKGAVTLSEKIQLIPLARKFMTQEFLEGEIVTASGWGRISDIRTINEIPNVKLYYVDAPILNLKECACFYLPGLVRYRNHICGDGSDGKSTCDGDSGGPLTYSYDGMRYLVGVTSFGSAGGCEIGYPAVYTKITNYLKWISERTGITII